MAKDPEVAIVGAGAAGLAAIEIGKILGATVIATAGSAAKLDAAKEHGADHVINYREEDFRAAVNDLTNGIGANAIYDPVGGEVFAQSLRCVAPEGRIMPVGFASGTIPQIPANILLVKNITVTGLNMGYYIGWSPDDVRYEKASIIHPLMQQMFDWFEAGKLNPRIWKTYKLEDFQDAMPEFAEYIQSGESTMRFGSVTLRIETGEKSWVSFDMVIPYGSGGID